MIQIILIQKTATMTAVLLNLQKQDPFSESCITTQRMAGKNSPLMDAIKVYEKQKSHEVIVSFNRSGLCVSYRTMKKHLEDLAELAISKSEQHVVPLPINVSKVSFTLTAFDNFGHNDKSTKFGTLSTHDTVSFLFKEVPSIKLSTPTKSKISLENVDMKVKLQWQEVIPFSTSKQINLLETFTVTSDQLHLSADDRERYEKQQFVLDFVRNIQKPSSNVLTWAGCKPFFQNSKFPQFKLDLYHL